MFLLPLCFAWLRRWHRHVSDVTASNSPQKHQAPQTTPSRVRQSSPEKTAGMERNGIAHAPTTPQTRPYNQGTHKKTYTHVCITHTWYIHMHIYLFEELLRLEVRQVLELGVHDASRVPHALLLPTCPVAVRLRHGNKRKGEPRTEKQVGVSLSASVTQQHAFLSYIALSAERRT